MSWLCSCGTKDVIEMNTQPTKDVSPPLPKKETAVQLSHKQVPTLDFSHITDSGLPPLPHRKTIPDRILSSSTVDMTDPSVSRSNSQASTRSDFQTLSHSHSSEPGDVVTFLDDNYSAILGDSTLRSKSFDHNYSRPLSTFIATPSTPFLSTIDPSMPAVTSASNSTSSETQSHHSQETVSPHPSAVTESAAVSNEVAAVDNNHQPELSVSRTPSTRFRNSLLRAHSASSLVHKPEDLLPMPVPVSIHTPSTVVEHPPVETDTGAEDVSSVVSTTPLSAQLSSPSTVSELTINTANTRNSFQPNEWLPQMSEEKAMDLSLLLSQQEAEHGVNMFDVLTPADASSIARLQAVGYSYEDAVQRLFDIRFGKRTQTNSVSDRTALFENRRMQLQQQQPQQHFMVQPNNVIPPPYSLYQQHQERRRQTLSNGQLPMSVPASWYRSPQYVPVAMPTSPAYYQPQAMPMAAPVNNRQFYPNSMPMMRPVPGLYTISSMPNVHSAPMWQTPQDNRAMYYHQQQQLQQQQQQQQQHQHQQQVPAQLGPRTP